MNTRHLFLALYSLSYERLLRPLIFLRSPEDAHRDAMRLLKMLDSDKGLCDLVERMAVSGSLLNMIATPPDTYGMIPPIMLAAGFVKGRGFADEESALRAVEAGENIIPGWRAMPALVGAVEFGSFTRYPRLGNSGAILWRDPATRSTQNRIGLRNPGARAAALFLSERHHEIPWYRPYGINIAVSPGVSDEAQEIAEVYESMCLFLDAGLRPRWFTLNLSCPNTEDDPEGNQTAAHARALCSALLAHPGLRRTSLWVKIGPELGAAQYEALMEVFAEVGVGAVIATNTLAQPVPEESKQRLRHRTDVIYDVPAESSGVGTPFMASTELGSGRTPVTAGVGGGRLYAHALDAVRHLAAARERIGCNVKIVGCGGVLDGDSARGLQKAGADALQYWSALIYRGPLAAAVIKKEIGHG